MSSTAPKPRTRKSFTDAFMTAGAHLRLSNNTIKALTKFAVNADDESVSALLELLAQPDPHRNLASVIPYKIRAALADYEVSDEADFAQWVKSANLCFHAVDALTRQLGHVDKPAGDDYFAARFIQGMKHYRESGKDYSNEQLKNLALICTAAYCAVLEAAQEAGKDIPPGIHVEGKTLQSDYPGPDHFWCHSITNQKIMDIAASSPETAADILHIVIEQRAYTEAQILYCLDGGHSALIDGAI